jgi:hypothetical protein
LEIENSNLFDIWDLEFEILGPVCFPGGSESEEEEGWNLKAKK